jgi:hypothetical protein
VRADARAAALAPPRAAARAAQEFFTVRAARTAPQRHRQQRAACTLARTRNP